MIFAFFELKSHMANIVCKNFFLFQGEIVKYI